MFHCPLTRRMTAVLTAGLLLLTPCSAAPAETSRAIPAVSALSPWQLPRNLAQSYQDQAALLTALGLSGEQIRVLWNRLGTQLGQDLAAGSLTPGEVEIRTLPNCREELLPRYSTYHRSHPLLSPETVVLTVNMGLDRPFYQDAEVLSMASGTSDPLILVNKYRALPQTYEPDLTPLGSLGSGSLTPQAAQAFSAMVQAARADGVTLRSVSAYRSYATQNGLYRRYRSQYSQSFTDSFSARAGYSEHQTGLALDINASSLLDHFETTRAYAWLTENCAQYGFILRYPQDKEDITGYRFEPWHYRYVGTEIASTCMQQGLTLEEYFAAQPSGWGCDPTLFQDGQALALDSGPIRLDGTWYLPVEETALALGWTPTEAEAGSSFVQGTRTVEFVPGLRCRVNGVMLRFTAPVLSVEGRSYLSAADLAAALDLEVQETGDSLFFSSGV